MAGQAIFCRFVPVTEYAGFTEKMTLRVKFFQHLSVIISFFMRPAGLAQGLQYDA